MRTLGHTLKSALKCNTKEEAELWFETEVKLFVYNTGKPPEEAFEIIRHNLGYLTGYTSEENAKKICKLFKVKRSGLPVFTDWR